MLPRPVQETIVRNRLAAGKFVFVSLGRGSETDPLVIADQVLEDKEWIRIFHVLARYIGITSKRFTEEIMLKLFEQEEEENGQLKPIEGR